MVAVQGVAVGSRWRVLRIGAAGFALAMLCCMRAVLSCCMPSHCGGIQACVYTVSHAPDAAECVMLSCYRHHHP